MACGQEDIPGHILMVGPPGAGKSFTVNRILAATARAGGSALVLDWGARGRARALGGRWMAVKEGEPILLAGEPGLDFVDLGDLPVAAQAYASDQAVSVFASRTGIPGPRLVVLPPNLPVMLGIPHFVEMYHKILQQFRKQGIAVVSEFQDLGFARVTHLVELLLAHHPSALIFPTNRQGLGLDILDLTEVEEEVVRGRHPAIAQLQRYVLARRSGRSKPLVLALDELGGAEPPLGALAGGGDGDKD